MTTYEERPALESNTARALAAVVAAGVKAGMWTVTEATSDNGRDPATEPLCVRLMAGTDDKPVPLVLLRGGYSDPGRIVGKIGHLNVLGRRVSTREVLHYNELEPRASVGAARDPLKAAKELHRKLVLDTAAADVAERLRQRCWHIVNGFNALLKNVAVAKAAGFEFPDVTPDQTYSIKARCVQTESNIESLEVYARGDARVTLTVPVEALPELLAVLRASTVS